jgi:glycosyltransferase involved in cell wall biosynthesis
MMCGVGDYTACLAEALGKLENTSVGVLTSQGVEYINRSDSNFEIFPLVDSWTVSESLRILRFIKRWHPDIVHIQYPTQGYAGGGRLPFLLPVLLLLLNIKVVQTWHEYYTKEMTNWLIMMKAVIPGPLVVVRPNYADHLPPLYRRLMRIKQVHFIPNASSLPRVSLSDMERREIHGRFAPITKVLVAYFGFLYPHKGIDLLFDIADPEKHHLVLIGAFDPADTYHTKLKERMAQRPWAGSVTIAGFQPPDEAACILAAADAVVLPFRNGGGLWNTSLHGAAIQGTFVLTTSREQHGYDFAQNIYYASPGNIVELRHALNKYAGRRNIEENIRGYPTWDSIAEAHASLYGSIL